MSAGRTFLLSVMCAAWASLLTACGHGQTSPPNAASASGSGHQTLHLYIGQSPTSLNPLLSTTVDESNLAALTYDTLVTVDAHGRLAPRLARIVPTRANGGISADGKTVTFALRAGVRWQDGQPLTSADVAFTFAKVLDPRVNVGQRSGYDRIASVSTPDSLTVVAHLRQPFTPFIIDVGYQYPIVPKHVLARSTDINHDPIGARPMGTGPYRFKRWDRGNKIEYVANEQYFGGAPAIKNITVAEIPDQNTVAIALRTGQLDEGAVSSSVYADLRRAPNVRTTTEPINDFVAYAINTTRPLMRDVAIRRAISLAIDRSSIASKNTFGTGTPAYADLPALFWKSPEPANPYGYRPAAADALLDAAGWRRGPDGMRAKDGVPLRIQAIDYSGAKTNESIDVQVQQMLRDVGIAWSVKYGSTSLYFESKSNGGTLAGGDYDMAVVAWQANPDPQNDVIYTCANRSPNGPNYARYCSPAMDALQSDSLSTLDPARRSADVVAIEKLAVTDVPYVFLYHTPWRIAWSPHLARTHSNASSNWYGVERWRFTSP